MNFQPIPLWAILAVSAWIAFDIGRGAMSGIADARKKQLDSTPLGEIVQTAAESFSEPNGGKWTKHATIHSVFANGSALTFSIALTSDAKSSIKPRWAKTRIVGMRHDIRKQVCRDEKLKYVLSRGGRIRFQSIEDRVANLLPTDVPLVLARNSEFHKSQATSEAGSECKNCDWK